MLQASYSENLSGKTSISFLYSDSSIYEEDNDEWMCIL